MPPRTSATAWNGGTAAALSNNRRHADSRENPDAMDKRSILVGKCYRTAEGEVREVSGVADGVVIYRSASAPHSPGTIASAPHQRLDLEQFADEVESEVGAR